MPQNYVPIFLFLAVIGIVVAAALLLAKAFRTQSSHRLTGMPEEECGTEGDADARRRFTVRYYIIAILFVTCDVETVFLFPWAVKFKALGGFGLCEMLVFLGILVVAY